MSRISTGPQHFEYVLRIGRGIELTANGELLIRAVIDVSHPRVSGTEYFWHSEVSEAPVESIEAAAALREVADEAQTHRKEAVNAFLDRLAEKST